MPGNPGSEDFKIYLGAQFCKKYSEIDCLNLIV